MARRNLTDQRFGNLVAVRDAGYTSRGGFRMWVCKCDCGNTKNVSLRCLVMGYTNSCGCEKQSGLRKQTDAERLAPGESAFNRLYHDYRRSAARKGRVFELTKDQFRVITSGNCFYCGAVPIKTYWANLSKLSGPYVYNGVDRLNNDVGYVGDNCVPCCWKCNRLKSDMSIDEFRSVIKTIHERICK